MECVSILKTRTQKTLFFIPCGNKGELHLSDARTITERRERSGWEPTLFFMILEQKKIISFRDLAKNAATPGALVSSSAG